MSGHVPMMCNGLIGTPPAPLKGHLFMPPLFMVKHCSSGAYPPQPQHQGEKQFLQTAHSQRFISPLKKECWVCHPNPHSQGKTSLAPPVQNFSQFPPLICKVWPKHYITFEFPLVATLVSTPELPLPCISLMAPQHTPQFP